MPEWSQLGPVGKAIGVTLIFACGAALTLYALNVYSNRIVGAVGIFGVFAATFLGLLALPPKRGSASSMPASRV
jgi:type IV secretory pathway VirB2 component (pilin)